MLLEDLDLDGYKRVDGTLVSFRPRRAHDPRFSMNEYQITDARHEGD